MKKSILLMIMSVSLLSGCGIPAMETTSCTYQTSTDMLTTNITYSIDYQDNEVKKLRITYNYMANMDYTTNEAPGIDGVGTGTDGTTSDTQIDEDGIVDGIVGSAIDTIVGTVTGTILDIAGIRDRHNAVLTTYGNIPGFSIQNTSDLTDDSYSVTYVIDYDTISDTDLNILNLSRNINTLKDNYRLQGFTCN